MAKDASNTIPPEEIMPALMRSNVLRAILTKHIELNRSADTKANLLLTASSIVIAVILTNFQNYQQTAGMFIVLLTSLTAIFFSILVILPKPYHKMAKDINLFYFRSFMTLSEEEYVDEMKKMMKNNNMIYEQYMRDIYQYGAFTLNKKYRLLKFALITFLTGLTLGGVEMVLYSLKFNF